MQTSILFVTLIFITVIGASASTDLEYRRWAGLQKQFNSKTSVIKPAASEVSQYVTCGASDTFIYVCASGNTCCPLPSGGYACCPHVNAVCCGDGVHCCPAQHICSISTGGCIHQSAVKLLQNVHAEPND